MADNPSKLNIELLEELLLLNCNVDIDLKSEIIKTLDFLPKDHAKKLFFISSRRYFKRLKKEVFESKKERTEDLNSQIEYAKSNLDGGGVDRINNHKRELEIVKSKSYKYWKTLTSTDGISISLNEIEEIEELCNTIEKEIILDGDNYSALEIAYYIYYMKEVKEEGLSFPFPSEDGYKELGKRFNKNWKNIQKEFLNISKDRDIRLKKGRDRKIKRIMKLLTPKALSLAELDLNNIY